MPKKVIMKTDLAPQIIKYVQFMREKIGRGFVTEEKILKAYDNFCFENKIEPLLSQDGFEKYCMSGNVGLVQRGKRYRLLHNFYEYCRAYDASLPEIAVQIVDAKYHKHTAYVYSDQEIMALMEADKENSQWSHACTVRWKCMIGLLFCTGIRVSELLSLKIQNIDFQNRTLIIKETKFRKNRLVPIHESTCAALRRWLKLRPNPQSEYVFQSLKGNPFSYSGFNGRFNKVLRQLGIGDEGRPKPRIHDMRHTFAIRKVVEWQRKGLPVQAYLPHLSTYMGHVHYDNTTYYLDSSEQLLANVLEKFTPIED
ncbi:MAG: tyrosine-type recombinase/integrase [Victivallales bacterium]|nr:tyrosine-type recombinase/integrase [Victivallales bacterium]